MPRHQRRSYQGKTQFDLWQVKVGITVRIRTTLVCFKVNWNTVQRTWKAAIIERQHFWQQSRHTEQYSDILMAFKEELISNWTLTPCRPSQWGAADAEIKVSSGESTELKCSPSKAWSRSVYSHTCYAYWQGFLPCLFSTLPGPFTCAFPQISSDFLSCVGWG